MVLGYASSMRGLDRLLELQELDSAIDRLEVRKRQLEEGKEMAAARATMEDAEGRLGELRLGVDSVMREQQRLEREMDSMTRKAEADQKRLYDGSIVNIKEMEALQHEITSLRERRSRSEDELLEQMVRRDDLESRAGEASTLVQLTRARLEAVGGEAVAELERIEDELAEKRATREKLGPEFDDERVEVDEGVRGG